MKTTTLTHANAAAVVVRLLLAPAPFFRWLPTGRQGPQFLSPAALEIYSLAPEPPSTDLGVTRWGTVRTGCMRHRWANRSETADDKCGTTRFLILNRHFSKSTGYDTTRFPAMCA